MSKKRRGDWLIIKEPKDLQRALQKMMNSILMADDKIDHAGQFAALANAWTNSFRANIDLIEMKEVKSRLEELEELRGYEEPKITMPEVSDLRQAIKAVGEL